MECSRICSHRVQQISGGRGLIDPMLAHAGTKRIKKSTAPGSREIQGDGS